MAGSNRLIVALCGLVLAGCQEPDSVDAEPSPEGAGGKADSIGGSEPLIAVTASNIEALEGDFDSVQPELGPFTVPDPGPEALLGTMGAQGHFGPLGAAGPLGLLGAVGTNAWNPSTYVGMDSWSPFAAMLAANDGPLSADGPLGETGPLNREQWRRTMEGLPVGDSATQQLEPGGLFVPLGPIGPLGALGPLGPLGPVGAHGYAVDDDGQYVVDGECDFSEELDVCRTVTVPWNDSETRTYELFERYTEEFAAEMTDNDTSFMVEGGGEVGTADVFEFTSAQDQIVTVSAMGIWTLYDPATMLNLVAQSALLGFREPFWVAAVPPHNIYSHSNSFDDYDVTLHIETERGVQTVTSESPGMVDFISVQVPAGAKVTAEVALYSKYSSFTRLVPSEYRLFVVGSTPEFSSIQVRGEHQTAH